MSERSLIQVLLLLQRVAAKSGTRSEGGECSIKIRLVSAHYLSQWRKGQRFLVCFFGDICRTYVFWNFVDMFFLLDLLAAKRMFQNSWLTLISPHNREQVRDIFFGGIGADLKFVKKNYATGFLCQKFYTLKMRKPGLILPTIRGCS